MSYKIQYSPETTHLYPVTKRRSKFKRKNLFGIAAVIVAVLWMHFFGIPDFLIPGDPQVTKTAATVLLDEIKNGVSVQDAVTTFCKIILDGAAVLY